MSAPKKYDWVIRNALVYDGNISEPRKIDVAVKGERIVDLRKNIELKGVNELDANGLALAPGFIDVHTHDDLEVLRNPSMTAKISQGVTTVITGNCGISASPLLFPEDSNHTPDPINLLGQQHEFAYPRFSDYVEAVNRAKPAVNVAALVGHTSLRASVMKRFGRGATNIEITQMRSLLKQALQDGAIGLSSGLAYANAQASTPQELQLLAQELTSTNGIYTTHLRTEFDGILDAMSEAFELGKKVSVPVVISHLKCAGIANWGRSQEVLDHLHKHQQHQAIGCDCYPYSASSSTLDLNQVTDEFDIFITWSESYPDMAEKLLADIAAEWDLPLIKAAEKLQPAGAVYHCIDEQDVERILKNPKTMIGSDGLPCDPHPHPRFWGSFPRVLGHYVRKKQLFTLSEAIHKMTGLSSRSFRLPNRGLIRPGYFADLVLFDADTIIDCATYQQPTQISEGIEHVWVNGIHSYSGQYGQTHATNGRFLLREE